MGRRIHPLWWPALVVTSPVIAPLLAARNSRFRENLARADSLNDLRIRRAEQIELPGLDSIEMTVLVEWEAEEGFRRDAGVSYLLRSNLGSVMFDVGFGPDRGALAHNARKLGIGIDQADALIISHLHPDHAGGMGATRAGRIGWPGELGHPGGKSCFLPAGCEAEGFAPEVVDKPRLLVGGFASTGPLARSLFFLGLTEEQAVVARLNGKGLVVFTGCGHPTIERILAMARRISDAPMYALVGGLHMPVSHGRGKYAGIQVQTILGTGKPPWQRITDVDLGRTISVINAAGFEKVCLSAHDTCDHALARMKSEIRADTQVLRTGKTYSF